jgi:prolyl 4-hydroxylase
MPRKVVLIITLFLLADFMCAQDHEFTNAQHDDAIYIESTDTKWHDLLASYGLHRPHGSGPAFDSFMTGCSKRYGTDLCHQRDKERLTLNLNQPRHQTNFTFAGYAKVKAPAKTFSILSDYWTKHNTTEANRKEDWDDANIYVNHWETETHVLPIDGLSSTERKLMIHQVRDVLEQWTSTQLLPSSVYGIRSYHNGSVLAPHVDRIPLVISAIINVAQDVTADWILQVFSHDGHTKNVTMAPGEMLLYESVRTCIMLLTAIGGTTPSTW